MSRGVGATLSSWRCDRPYQVLDHPDAAYRDPPAHAPTLSTPIVHIRAWYVHATILSLPSRRAHGRQAGHRAGRETVGRRRRLSTLHGAGEVLSLMLRGIAGSRYANC